MAHGGAGSGSRPGPRRERGRERGETDAETERGLGGDGVRGGCSVQDGQQDGQRAEGRGQRAAGSRQQADIPKQAQQPVVDAAEYARHGGRSVVWWSCRPSGRRTGGLVDWRWMMGDQVRSLGILAGGVICSGSGWRHGRGEGSRQLQTMTEPRRTSSGRARICSSEVKRGEPCRPSSSECTRSSCTASLEPLSPSAGV